MIDVEPYAVRDERGHELMVLGARYVVVIHDRAAGTATTWAEPDTYTEALAVLADLAADGIAADIEVELDTVDLTAAASPLAELAVEFIDPDRWTT